MNVTDWLRERRDREPAPGVKRSVYFTDEDVAEIRWQAKRLRRSQSWVVQEAWRIARPVLQGQPTFREKLPGAKP